MLEELQNIKEQLFDAPSEVKEAFNQVVSYFDDSELFWIKYIENGGTKWYKFKAKDKKEAEKILKGWERDYPDWIDYKTAEIFQETYWVAYKFNPSKSSGFKHYALISENAHPNKKFKVGDEFGKDSLPASQGKIVFGPASKEECQKYLEKHPD